MRIITKGATDQSVDLYITDNATGLPATGLLFNSAGIDLWYRRPGAAKTSIAEVTLAALTTAHADGGFLEIGNGNYRLDLPDAAVATGVDHVLVGGTFTGYTVYPEKVQLAAFDLQTAAVTLAAATHTGAVIPTVTNVTNPVKLPNEWYVSTTGSDANAGTSKAAPLLTIAAAYTAASPGDVINLAEGTWSGALSLSKNGITLRGASRTGTILTHNSGFTLNVATISARIERMTINATAETSSGTALGLNGCYDVVVRDCTINGKFDGCSGTTAKNLRFYDCEINGTFDGLNLSRSSNSYLENCHISSSADYSTDNAFRAFYAGESTTTVTSQITTGRAVGCTFSIVRTGTSALNQNTSAAEVAGHWDFIGCKFLARASNASYGGIVYGLTEPSETVGGVNLNAPSHVKMEGCTYNTSNAGSAGVFDAVQRRTNSDMAIDGGHYTAAKVSGATMRDSSPSAAMVNTAVEAGAAGTNAATAATQSTAANTAIADVPTNAELATAIDPLPTAAENAAAVIASTAAGTAGTVGKILADYAAVKPATTIAAADDVESGGGTPVSADVIDDSRTWFANEYRARNIISVGDNFDGTFALQPDLNPGTTISTVDSVSITGAATVTATGLTVNRAKTRAHFTVPTLATTGTYTVVVTVTTIDGQTIPTTATLKVQ